MKKYLYPLIYVLLHVSTIFVLYYICGVVLELSIIRDLKVITIWGLTICSIEWFLWGFLSNMKLKYKPKEMIILTVIIFVLLNIITMIEIDLYVFPLNLLHMFSFSGLFMESLIRGNLLGEFDIPAFSLYYTLIFILGIFANKIIHKLRN